MALPTTPIRLTAGNDDWSLTTPTLQDQWVRGLEGDDKITGSDGNDRLEGGAGNNTLRGGLGNDTLIGGAGNDWLEGGDGNDVIRTGGGNDVVYAGSGNDVIYDSWAKGAQGSAVLGGDGYDTLRIDSTTTFNGVTGAAQIERFIGNLGDDTLDLTNYSSSWQPGTPLPDGSGKTPGVGVRIDAGGGNDTITGTGYADRLYGGDGLDILKGGAGNDTISGGAGHLDQLMGGAGNDVLLADGSGGQDFMTGGAGNDRFDLRALGGTLLSGNSTSTSKEVFITDFTKGEDKIDLRGLGIDVSKLWFYEENRGGVVKTLVSLDGDPTLDFSKAARLFVLENMKAADITADMFLT